MSKSRNYQKTRDDQKSFRCHVRNKSMRQYKPYQEMMGAYVFEVYVGEDRVHSEVCGEYGWNDNVPAYKGIYS